jgi:hypothetical protein
MENAWLHMLAVTALTAGIAFTVVTIVVLDRPLGEICE